jgi:rubrerythrin
MNLQNILAEIEKVDPEVYQRLDTRRNTMRRFAFAGKVLAAAAVPSALGSMFKKAYGQMGSSIADVLQFALTLEHLEAEFYTQAVQESAELFTPEGLAAFTTIRDHEVAHVALLQQTLISLNETPAPKPTFDFTAGGAFADVFTNYDLLLAVAQAFEDTGVRAYKGQAANLISNNVVLEAALRIHSVEARHAAHLRYMRRNRPSALVVGNVKPWITGKESGIATDAVQPIYDGEEVTTQANVQIVNINGQNISAAAASEAFDEPLTKEQVLAIVTPFLGG